MLGRWPRSLASVPQESTTFAVSNRVRPVTPNVKTFALFKGNLIYQLPLRRKVAYHDFRCVMNIRLQKQFPQPCPVEGWGLPASEAHLGADSEACLAKAVDKSRVFFRDKPE